MFVVYVYHIFQNLFNPSDGNRISDRKQLKGTCPEACD